MARTLPSQVPLTNLPSWAATVQAAIEAGLNGTAAAPNNVGWPVGTRTRNITLTASQFSVAAITSATAALIVNMMNEYLACGFVSVNLVSSTMDGQNNVVSMTFEFARWPATA